MTSSTSCARALRKKLQAWFRVHGRELPWRTSPTPYAVAVSEVMLQQTTVAAVMPRFRAWMRRFPTVRALAAACETDVLKAWQGLGYYRRARDLHRAASVIVTKHAGRFPKNPEDLRSLPGFGQYTAAALQAFAWDRPVVVIDANIARVLARLANLGMPVDKAPGRAALEGIARSLLPAGGRGGRNHTSALMDLGAMVCTARNPSCPRCPVREFCKATNPASLPVKAARSATTPIEETRAWVTRRGRIGLVRSVGPRWRGLWVFPPATNPADMTPLHIETHTLTRFRIRMSLVKADATPPGIRFFPPDDLPPMPSPHARAASAMLRNLPATSIMPHAR
jgi:A/G-specific adenine glycosylase